jgi:hypothetical protein
LINIDGIFDEMGIRNLAGSPIEERNNALIF